MREMTLQEVQAVLLEMLKEIHSFCVEHDIKYSLSGGTMLGAVRHNGFIPWDDDADIQMLRPEYEKFIRLYTSSSKYKVFARETEDGGSVLTRIARFHEIEETYLDQGSANITEDNVGVWVDIIPVEGAPSTETEAKKFIRGMAIGYQIIRCLQVRKAPFLTIKRYSSIKKVMKFVLGKLISYIIPKSFVDVYIDYCKQYHIEESSYFVATDHYGIGEWQPKWVMSDYVLHKFENTELYIMSGYDYNLTALYGNYMKWPPVEKRVKHSTIKFYWRK